MCCLKLFTFERRTNCQLTKESRPCELGYLTGSFINFIIVLLYYFIMVKPTAIFQCVLPFLFLLELSSALKEGDCEVCVGVLNKLVKSLDSSELSSPTKIEAKFREFCLTAKKSEERFCYYIGGLEESATKILSEMSKPLSWSLPIDKVCEKLKKKDVQICDLKYEKVIDLKTVDLKKLKVKDLKKILLDWGERCDGCLEKTDFIKRIEELKPQYTREEL